MVEADLDRIMEIEEATFTTKWSRDAFEQELNRNVLAHYLVGEVDGYIVGYGGIWLIIDEGHITNIAVEEDYRGLGVGNIILEGLIELSRNNFIKALTLEVRKSNEVARSLYSKYGFTNKGVRRNYYRDDGEDALIMWKTMEEEKNE